KGDGEILNVYCLVSFTTKTVAKLIHTFINLYTNTMMQQKKYKIGLALSGGGIRGISHAGALLALEELNIHPEIISGVSAGAIIGALYADGYTPWEIAKMFEKIRFKKMTKLIVP